MDALRSKSNPSFEWRVIWLTSALTYEHPFNIYILFTIKDGIIAIGVKFRPDFCMSFKFILQMSNIDFKHANSLRR